MSKFFDEDFFKFVGMLIISSNPPGKKTMAGGGREAALKLLKEKVEEYNEIFSNPERAVRQRLIAREVQLIYSAGGANSHLLRLFFVFFSETLAPIPMSL
jgi:hypothetical protein